MASFHTPSLGDEPSYQAVKAPANPLSAYALFFKVTDASGVGKRTMSRFTDYF